MQVGVPGMHDFRHNVLRQPVNSRDKATIVSIYPRLVQERKFTIEPGYFEIQPGSIERPAILVVGPSSWWKALYEENTMIEIPQSSVLVAESIIKDYCNGIFGCDMGPSMPGMFFVEGEYTVDEIQAKFKNKLKEMETRQKTFWTTLVKFADSLWARSQGNPMAISDDMRMAARELNLTSTRDWMRDFTMVNMVRCQACGALKNSEYPICATCHFPDPGHPMTKQLLAAKKEVPQHQPPTPPAPQT